MSEPTITIGSQRCDTTRALLDGEVSIEGARASFRGAPIVSDLFRLMLQDHAFDVCELGLSLYLRTLDLDEPPVVALPVFPVRHFRHSAIFINKSRPPGGPGAPWPGT